MDLKLANPIKKNNSSRNKVNYFISNFSVNKFKRLLTKNTCSSGRGKCGNITVRHKGHIKPSKLISVDYRRSYFTEVHRVSGIIRDNFRTAPVMLLAGQSGIKRYSLHTDRVYLNQPIQTTFYFFSAATSCGNSIPVGWIPKNIVISNLELSPGLGGKLGRSAGTYLKVLSHTSNSVEVQTPSKARVFVSKYSLATVGRVGFIDHKLENIGNAGFNRFKGRRPAVRGEAMNAVDHPHGGRTKGGKPRQSPWGRILK